MASRKDKNKNNEPEVEVVDPTDEASATEATDAPAEVTEAAPTDKPAEPDPSDELLAQFKSVHDEVVGVPVEVTDDEGNVTKEFSPGERGEHGALSDESMAKIVEAYTKLKPHRKAADAALKYVFEQLSVTVNLGIGTKGAEQAARALITVRQTLEATKAPRAQAERKPVDVTKMFVEQYAAVMVGQQILFNSPPEGVAEDWAEQAEKLHDSVQDELTSYLTWLATDEAERGDEPEVSDVVKAGVRLAQGKPTKGRKAASGGTRAPFTGKRGNVLAHIQHAFSTVNEGDSMTVAQIAAIKSDEYEAGQASAGAISARLFGKGWDVEATGIKPNPDATPKTATKVA